MRTMKEARHRILDKLKIAQAIIVTIFGCMFWFQTERSEETVRDMMGIFFYSCNYWGMVCLLGAVNSFPEERPVINRERAAGIYRLSAYYMAKMTSELPLNLIMPTVYMTAIYWSTGFTPAAANFFGVLFTMLLFVIAMQGFGIFLGCCIVDFRMSLTTGLSYMMLSMMAGGYYQRHMAYWAAWIKYLSMSNYVFHALVHIEFAYGEPIMCLPPNKTFFSSCVDNNITMVTGVEVLEAYDITWPLCAYYVVIGIFIIVTRTLGYIFLRFVNKPPGMK